MKKTLIALALTALPVAAMAEVTLYGVIKAGYEGGDSKVTNKSRTPFVNGIADYGSRIGFKGSEDIGHGLKAIWTVEANTPVAGDAWTTRQAFIGLEGGFGTLRAGTLPTFVESDMKQVDAWESGSEALSLKTMSRYDGFKAGVRYDTPTIAGFNAAILYRSRDTAAGTSIGQDRPDAVDLDKDGEDKKELLNVGLGYENAGIFAKYSYMMIKNTVINGNDNKDGQIHRVEGGYDANNIYAALAYQFANNSASNRLLGNSAAKDAKSAVKGQEIAITGGYHFGNIFPKITYAHGFDLKSTLGNKDKYKNTKYDQILLGADYDFSKRTKANVQVGWLRQGDGKNADGGNVRNRITAVGAGLQHTF